MKKIVSISTAAAALMLIAAPASAFGWGSMTWVSNSNEASVTNFVSTSADTGNNDANGDDGEEGGNGGDIETYKGSVSRSSTGNGGAGGDGGNGGIIGTGAAYAESFVGNSVNENITNIDSCGCEGRRGSFGKTMVWNRNGANVLNDVNTDADTGDNDANGDDGEEGGNGGDIEAKGWWFFGGEVSNSDTGNGGAGGDGGHGGVVLTGEAGSWSEVLNVVNRNVTRIRR